MVEYHPISAKVISTLHQIGPTVLPGVFLPKTCRDCISSARKSHQVYSLALRHTWEESGKETLWSQTLRNWHRWPHLKSTRKDAVLPPNHIPSRRWNSQNLWRRSTSENIHLNQGSSRTMRGTRSSSRRI